jgi:hypothetical protein
LTRRRSARKPTSPSELLRTASKMITSCTRGMVTSCHPPWHSWLESHPARAWSHDSSTKPAAAAKTGAAALQGQQQLQQREPAPVTAPVNAASWYTSTLPHVTPRPRRVRPLAPARAANRPGHVPRATGPCRRPGFSQPSRPNPLWAGDGAGPSRGPGSRPPSPPPPPPHSRPRPAPHRSVSHPSRLPQHTPVAGPEPSHGHGLPSPVALSPGDPSSGRERERDRDKDREREREREREGEPWSPPKPCQLHTQSST